MVDAIAKRIKPRHNKAGISRFGLLKKKQIYEYNLNKSNRTNPVRTGTAAASGAAWCPKVQCWPSGRAIAICIV